MKKILLVILLLFGLFFRIYSLMSVPPSLYWEEVALGYDSYSILNTGKDHHGNPFPIIAFESFGDWKPSLYFYYLVPFIAVLGVSDIAIRVAATVVGVAVLIAMPILAKKLGFPSLIALAVTAVSPWAIQFSRSAWESNLALALIVWGMICALQKSKIWLAVSAVLFGLSMYAYHSARVIAPVLFICCVAYSWPVTKLLATRSLKKIAMILDWRQYLVPALLFMVALAPLVWAVLNNDVSITHRFQETNIFSDIAIIEKSNQLKELAGNTWGARIFYHRYVLFAEEIVKNIFSYFTLDYLILHGDQNLRHGTHFVGILYPVEIIFLIVGLYAVTKKSKKTLLLFAVWVLVSLLPASITTPNPHSLRTLIALPVFMLLIAEGIQSSYQYLFNLKINSAPYKWLVKVLKNDLRSAVSYSLVGVIIFSYLVQVGAYWRYYTTIYPINSAGEWQYGYKQLISVLDTLPETDVVYVSRSLGRPAMYYWFYSKTDPEDVQREQGTVPKDQSEFLAFKNVTFYRSPSEITYGPNTVIAMPLVDADDFELQDEYKTQKFSELAVIFDQKGQPIWKVLKVSNE